MNIDNFVFDIRNKVKTHGNYREVAERSGVGYQWLAKFATGAIKNPTVNNISKLQIYFSSVSD